MSAFKDAVSRDVKAVFINLDEFADKHIIDGETVACIVDKDIISEVTSSKLEGVFLNTLTIYVAAKDINPKPVKDQLIELDGERYFVANVGEEDGILVIILEANQQ